MCQPTSTIGPARARSIQPAQRRAEPFPRSILTAHDPLQPNHHVWIVFCCRMFGRKGHQRTMEPYGTSCEGRLNKKKHDSQLPAMTFRSFRDEIYG